MWGQTRLNVRDGQDLMWGQPPPAVRGAKLRSAFYFLNRLSNAARALLGFTVAGVEVSFSRVTRIS
jgi:hypothetical protein